MTCRPNLSFNFIFFYTILPLHRSQELLVQNVYLGLILFLVLFRCPYMAIDVPFNTM